MGVHHPLLQLSFGLLLATACSSPKAAVPPGEDFLITDPSGPEPRSAGGFEIVAGWTHPYRAFFDVAGGQLSWTDGHDVFVGPDFDHGVGLHIDHPPERWVSDETDIYWATDRRELWRAGRGRRSGVVWRFNGTPTDLTPGPGSVYVVLRTENKSEPTGSRELWRITKDKGEASRVAVGPFGVVVPDGDTVYYASGPSRLGRITGAGSREDSLVTGLPGFVGLDGRHLYGADGAYIYRAPKSGGGGAAMARLDRDMVRSIWTRTAHDAYAAIGGKQLCWIAANRLYAASTEGGPRRLLAAFTGNEYRVLPAGDHVYVGDFSNGAVYRVPLQPRAGAVQVSPTADHALGAAALRSRAFWITNGDIRTTQTTPAGPDRTIAKAPPVGSRLAVDERFVYFTSAEGDLWRVAAAGGNPEKLVDVRKLMPKATPSRGGGFGMGYPRTVAIDGAEIFFVSQRWGALVRVSADGSGARVLARDLIVPAALLVDDRRLYFLAGKRTVSGSRILFALQRSGGRVTEIGPPLTQATQIAVSLDAVYVADFDGRLLRIPKRGGEATTLRPPGPARIAALTAGPRALFFSSADRILRLDEGAATPNVIVSGLLHPAGSMFVDGSTLYFADDHDTPGAIVGSLYALALQR